MRDLESKFAAAAAIDGDIYLPNFTPSGPVDAVLIGMEPSLGRWARTPENAAGMIVAGFRNFMWSPEDFILHYAARRFLCSAEQTYHITDVSKGAMNGDKANIDRRARYSRWAALLDEEVGLVAKPGRSHRRDWPSGRQVPRRKRFSAQLHDRDALLAAGQCRQKSSRARTRGRVSRLW